MNLTPILWPRMWKDPSALNLLKGTAINCLLIDRAADLGTVAARAQQEGLKVLETGSQMEGVTVVKGEWPGVKLNQSGQLDRAGAGPTGVPWVDSNGWKVRLASLLHPGTAVWVDAVPKLQRLFAQSYLISVADAAAHGGRWILSLDEQIASGLFERKPESLEVWKKIIGATAFFAEQQSWTDYLPEAVLGVISDFSGPNEFLSHEVLNLVARTNQQYRIILKNRTSTSSLNGLKAVSYTDDDPPDSELRKRILTFVEAGGLLITGPKWGPVPDIPSHDLGHPRYALWNLGEGRVAVAKTDFEDPYIMANDFAILISHRHELLRFWNGGAVSSYFTMKPDRTRGVVQMVFYAPSFFGNTSLRVAGRYRAARLRTLAQPEPQNVEQEVQAEAIELHLPRVFQYAALELEV